MNELNHNNGKGDKDRSPGWRSNYDIIDFQRGATDGFSRRGNRLVKTYTPGRKAVFVVDLPKPECDCQKPGYVSVGECVCEREPVKCNGRCLLLAEGCSSHNDGWCCSLPQGHAGDHIACSQPLHDLAHWGPPVTAAAVSADMLEKGVKL